MIQNVKGLCISKGDTCSILRAKRAENFPGFSRVKRCFGTIFARSAKKIFEDFKGKMRFLVPGNVF